MPKLTIDTAAQHASFDGFDGHYDEAGDLTIGFEAYSRDEDPSPLFVGLPDGHCQARHWGVVLEGTMTFTYLDGSRDVIHAGEAYYAPPGHLPVLTAGTRVVEFTPTTELAATMAVVEANLAAMQAG